MTNPTEAQAPAAPDFETAEAYGRGIALTRATHRAARICAHEGDCRSPLCDCTLKPPRDPHPTVPILVWADVDVGIADMVRYLNTLAGVRTDASCQGTIGEGGPNPYRAQVLCTWTDEIFERLQAEFDITTLGDHWGYLHPRNGWKSPIALASSSAERSALEKRVGELEEWSRKLAATIGELQIAGAELKSALATAHQRAAEAMREAWQPIETAPKDGRWLLLFSPDATETFARGQMIGQWRDDDEMPDGGAWWENNECGFPIDADPSHWQPLPVPPAGEKE